MASEVYAYILLALEVVVIVTAYLLAAKLLDWSGRRPLPGAKSRLFNVSLVILTAIIAIFLLLTVPF